MTGKNNLKHPLIRQYRYKHYTVMLHQRLLKKLKKVFCIQINCVTLYIIINWKYQENKVFRNLLTGVNNNKLRSGKQIYRTL